MTEPSQDRTKALELMAEYLKRTLADQLAMTRDSDTKLNLRLTICAGILGLVTFGLPALARAHTPLPWRIAAILAIIIFGFCLWRTLKYALDVLNVHIDLPGLAKGAFQSAVQNPNVTSIKVLQDLVQNYAMAAESNTDLIESRKPPGTSFRVWSQRTLGTGFIAVALSGMVYITAGPDVKPATDKGCVMADDSKQSDNPATPQASPAAASAADDVPSLIARPQRVDLEKSAAEPKPGKPLTFKEQPPEKSEKKKP